MFTLVNVIEPRLNQLMGAFMQRVSFEEHVSGEFDHRLVIIRRKESSAESLVPLAGKLGFVVETADPAEHPNPFLNRWRGLDANPCLQDREQVAFLDWDIVCVAESDFPGDGDGRLFARRNPADLYQPLARSLRQTFAGPLITQQGDVPSSINGGVLIGSGKTLDALRGAHLKWLGRVNELDQDIPEWQSEQLSLSLAAGEVGWTAIDDAWNVTPGSPVADRDVVMWHYNDGVEETRNIKSQMLRPDTVGQLNGRLMGRWKNASCQFARFYEMACREHVFLPFLQ